ncbi:maleylpyruvate isomerase N-terminal domain-containing protein [Streptomyces orinoci]|uniref:Maleylpyruvate isomerase N-terminal domain-containing protein n=1 Tax=Streptomyces orinoci TaxID=67339 RepID=A0ABV3JZM2_STRON|nr:maleylpyruvate isomerase N-terminal domain-containing protein [Streptomyces orinoci]
MRPAQRPPTGAVAEAHRVLRHTLTALDDDHIARPSALPGWSRGHVPAHLADAARMYLRVAEHALRGELVPPYPGGTAWGHLPAVAGGATPSSPPEPGARLRSTGPPWQGSRSGWRHSGPGWPTTNGRARSATARPISRPPSTEGSRPSDPGRCRRPGAESMAGPGIPAYQYPASGIPVAAHGILLGCPICPRE